MAKANKTMFFCKECGYESSKWLGQCPGCREVGTFVEEPIGKKTKTVTKSLLNSMPVTINQVTVNKEELTSTGFSELDRVLGGGIVAGGLILVGGDPGIGKSTLLLQVCRNISNNGKKLLYISGEESLKQIKIRASSIISCSSDTGCSITSRIFAPSSSSIGVVMIAAFGLISRRSSIAT